MKKIFLVVMVALLCVSFAWTGGKAETAAAVTETEFMRFFGECSDDYGQITDLEDTSNFAGECSIIQIMTNAYNEKNPDTPVRTNVVDWPGYVTLNTRLAAGDPPDIMILHGIRIPNYASRGLLTPLDDQFRVVGINPDEFSPASAEYVKYDGTFYGVPQDLHGHLYYINLDMWGQAGLLNADGTPRIPTNWNDWQVTARRFFDATGKTLFTWPGTGLSRDWMALVYQQGGSIETADGMPNINTREGNAALSLILEMMDGVFSERDAVAVGEMFSNQETGSHRNGTWMVNNFHAQAQNPTIPLSRFYVTSFPQFFDARPATWSSTHAYIVPLGVNPNEQRLEGAMKFLKFMNDFNDVWAYTGHFPINQSYIESEEYLSIPYRRQYQNFTDDAVPMPRRDWVTAFESIMNEEIQGAVLGSKTVERALADAQSRFNDFARFGQ